MGLLKDSSREEAKCWVPSGRVRPFLQVGDANRVLADENAKTSPIAEQVMREEDSLVPDTKKPHALQ
jgi:hypothetical protein